MKPLSALILSALTFLPLYAVEEGASLNEVIAEKGEPSSRMQAKDTLVLNYPGETIRLRDGKVISINNASGGPSKSATTPATSPTAPAAPAKPAISKAPAAAAKSGVAEGEWTTDYRAALAQAKEENRQVFLFFTGSDWCGWCKRLDAEVLSTPEFQAYAKKKLILVKLDFPRRTPQSSQVKQQNQRLQEQYQIEGYPSIVVLNSRGKTIGQLGYQPGGPKPFVDQLKGF